LVSNTPYTISLFGPLQCTWYITPLKTITMKNENYIGLGIITGVVVGILTDNLGLWISLGLLMGVVLQNKHNNG
jgi:hypothetical protein